MHKQPTIKPCNNQSNRSYELDSNIFNKFERMKKKNKKTISHNFIITRKRNVDVKIAFKEEGKATFLIHLFFLQKTSNFVSKISEKLKLLGQATVVKF